MKQITIILINAIFILIIISSLKTVFSQVTVREDNALIVNNKPFFPIGLYLAIRKEPGWTPQILFPKLKEWGFNTLEWFILPSDSDERIKEIFNLAEKNNLKLLPELSDSIRINYNRNFINNFVQSYKSYTSILAWYSVDEPSISNAKFEDVNNAYNLIKELDSSHPIFLLDYGQENLETFGKATDILGTDPYPIPGFPLKRVADFTDMANQAVAYKKPVWIAIQAHNLANYGSPNGRFPTVQEEKAMVYLALTHGAKGIFYYSFGDVINNETLWNSLKNLNSEINELSPILLSADIEQVVQVNPPLQNNEGIHMLLKSYQNQWYLFAVNSENKNINAAFTIPSDWSERLVNVYKEDRIISIANHQFIDNFEAFDIHIYIITSPSADANRDGKVDLQDFEIWRKEFTGELTTRTSDFNNDGKVDMIDFESWRKGFFAANQ